MHFGTDYFIMKFQGEFLEPPSPRSQNKKFLFRDF